MRLVFQLETATGAFASSLGGTGGLPEIGLTVSPEPPDIDRVRSLGRSYSSMDIDLSRAALLTCCIGTEETEKYNLHQSHQLKQKYNPSQKVTNLNK